MQTRAAILWEPHTEWSVEDIELDPPKRGELLVKLAASGLCHSDEHMVTGDMVLDPELAEAFGLKQFPVIGGHEGAGVVQEVGPDTVGFEVGDHVVFSFIPSCGKCPSCSTGKQHLCDLGAFLLSGMQLGDFSYRHHAKDGRDLGIMVGLGTFSPYTVVNVDSAVKIEKHIPLDKAALVGCGVTTGWGSAVYAADVQPGESVAVIGIGGIGMAAVQGAALAGARHVIAIDPVDWKREKALTLGATHAAASMEEAQPLINQLTYGQMADKAILAVGLATGDLINPMMGLIKKSGRGVVTAVANMMAEDVKLNLFDMSMQRKELVGCIFGNANPRYDIPRLLHLYMEGKLKLDEMVTTEYSLDEINQGYQDMRDGKNIRGLIRYE
ncbi:NDMA-dependent alcohol dehydrogenase [Nocardioides mangrovi]|uniref:NDMA-dependent alcohol dehydrogenase n=1 Tax=Nocardioides mangrovi TaxID=2874580 RepID=A0ABS7UHF7_9ACTN|nr:NDMA-dependent alcohol dehydrogenase [Nocardioides mangrovi]MBZ5740037.1 NDMA-dependent alcohol dehydrogenase [Nocardioides mangrovi]MBZ5740792.1 NDMA-dependent alcohol dehydrogenase [Nocardioides mangrovi]